ncbi:F-box/kelch-repeat protein At3g23880-like [Lotus japonicus]|uniref:F-box/kelch-repeat protein At3g23880-like n=1 Tax=Lotus japonicus TaxID=34305 RepID=UPI002588EB62|nr:F-box/kelch-repeat protein At3g23880-like [Lotus japonicus]
MKVETQHVPQDFITEILLRLPVKSLIRFKGVCKFWRSLISDPHFAKSHFELGAHSHRLALIKISHGIQTIDLDESLHSNPIYEPIKMDFSSTAIGIDIVGSCRGFLLLTLDERLYVWNPSTRAHNPIPSSHILDNYHLLYGFGYIYGFGYDSSKDDYLVVQVYAQYAEFFSLRTNMWKPIEGVADLPRLKLSTDLRPGLLFNEAIHWLSYNCDESTYVIIVFDLTQKRLVEIPQPYDTIPRLDEIARGGREPDCSLWVHGSFLSLSVFMWWTSTIEIWDMKKYKVESTWNKTLVLSSSSFTFNYSLLCSTKSGDIFMNNIGEVVKCRDKGNLLEPYCKYRDGDLEFHVPMYTESILSLPDVDVSEQSEEDD